MYEDLQRRAIAVGDCSGKINNEHLTRTANLSDSPIETSFNVVEQRQLLHKQSKFYDIHAMKLFFINEFSAYQDKILLSLTV